MNEGRVFLAAEWRYLALLNYEVDANLLRPLVPAGTCLDAWNNKVLVSLVGFLFLKTRLFGLLQIPFHSNFEEVNLRFYVRRELPGEVRRGVVFIREIVPRRAIAFVARALYNESYLRLPMTHQIRSVDDRLSVKYRWQVHQHGEGWSEISLQTNGNPALPAEGSIEQFITEHYWGYAAQPDGGSKEYRVTHPTWEVWQVSESTFTGDSESLYGNAFAALLRRRPHSAFLARGSAVSVMSGRRL